MQDHYSYVPDNRRGTKKEGQYETALREPNSLGQPLMWMTWTIFRVFGWTMMISSRTRITL